MGALASTHYYIKKGVINFSLLRSLGVGAMLGGALGTTFVYWVGNHFMERILPFLLISMAIYFCFSKNIGDTDQKAVFGISTLSVTLMPLIGFYDGFFGPGAGTFYMAVLISLGGMAVANAVAYSRVLNLISNAISLIVFVALGKMVWAAGIAMSIGEVAGVYIGSHLVLKKGSALVKPLVVIACVLISLGGIVS